MIARDEFTHHIGDVKNQVTTFQRFSNFRHHLASEGTVGFVHPRGVDQNHLSTRPTFLLRNVDNTEYAIPRSLRLRADDGELLAHECVQQRGLPGVGPAENADETGMEGHGSGISSRFSVLNSHIL